MKIDTGTYYTGLIKVALALKKSGRYEPIIFFNNDHPSMAVNISDCQQRNLTVINGLPDGAVEPGVRYNSALQRESASRLTRRLQSHPLRQYILLRQKLVAIEKFLSQQAIDILVYGGENAWYDTALYNQVARRLTIPTVALPQWMAGPREPAEHIFDDPAYSLRPLINRLAGWLWPKWVLNYRGKKLIRLPGQEVIARQFLGVAPPLPWVLHSGRTDILAVENQAMFDHGVRNGLPRSQLRVIGSIDHDILTESLRDRDSLRRRLIVELALLPNRPIILSAVPPNFLTGSRLATCDFSSYHELLFFWVKSILACTTHAVVFHPHPSLTEDDLAYVRSLGGKISTRTISEIIPLADIFVASISSTIQWAIACGLPVVNYDMYRYRYEDYDSVAGVITIEEQKDFIDTLSRVTNDREYFEKLQRQQQVGAAAWGQLDGQSKLRIVALFDTLTKNYFRQSDRQAIQ